MPKKGWRCITIREREYSTLLDIKKPDESIADVVERILERPWTWQRFITALATLKETQAQRCI